MQVDFWYRKPVDHYFSIENVFDGVAEELSNQGLVQVNKKYVPHETNSLWQLLDNRRFAKKHNGTVSHITGDIYYLTPYLKGRKILTIHDFVLFRRIQNQLKLAVYKYIWYTQPIRSADIITVISPQIEEELLDRFRVAPEKIRVIPNFYKPFFLNFQLKGRPLGRKVLFIGDTENKNLTRVAAALEGLNVELHIVGRPTATDLELLQANKVDYRVHTSITDTELGKLYQECSLLLFPSLYEGFGLPIIEAQSTGLPVITSNVNPMKWVAGDAALLVDPMDIRQIREAVSSLLGNSLLQQQLVQAGFMNIERFSVSAVARQYAACYQ